MSGIRIRVSPYGSGSEFYYTNPNPRIRTHITAPPPPPILDPPLGVTSVVKQENAPFFVPNLTKSLCQLARAWTGMPSPRRTLAPLWPWPTRPTTSRWLTSSPAPPGEQREVLSQYKYGEERKMGKRFMVFYSILIKNIPYILVLRSHLKKGCSYSRPWSTKNRLWLRLRKIIL